MFKTILCAIDGSAATERQLLYVMHFGKTEDASLHVVHGYQLPTHYAAQEGYATLVEQYRQVAINVVEDALAYLRETRIEVSGEAILGPAAEVILDEASRIDADLILIGGRNPSDVREMFLGSVSQQVLTVSRIPVLVIP